MTTKAPEWFREGLPVKLERTDGIIDDARLGFYKDEWFVCTNEIDLSRTMIPARCRHDYSYACRALGVGILNAIKPIPRTIKDGLYKGDVVVKPDGKKIKVLEVYHSIIFVSRDIRHDMIFAPYLLDEVIHLGWRLVDEAPKSTYTKKQIAEKLGLNVDEFEIID